MLKFTNQFNNSGLVLIKKQIKDGSCSALILLRGPARSYSVEKCPPATQAPKSRKLLYGTLGTIIIAGAGCVYAKNSPDARNWLESNAPWANNFIAVVYQENTTYPKFAWTQFDKVKTKLGDFLFGKEGVTPMELKQRSEQDIEKDAKAGFAPKSYPLPTPTLEPLYVEEVEVGIPEMEIQSTIVQTEKCDPPPPPKYNISKDVVELEQDMHENTRIAVDEFKKGIKLCAEYNKALHKIFEPVTPNDLPPRYFSSLKGLLTERNATLKRAKEAAAKSRNAMDTLEKLIQDKELNAPQDRIAMTQRYIKNFREDLNRGEKACDAEYDKFVLYDKFPEKVMEARNQYKEELQMLFPDADLQARLLEPKGDTDLLLLYTMRQIQFLQNELAEAKTVREAKINRAIECKDENLILEAKAEDMARRDKIAREMEFSKKMFAMMVEQRNKQNEQLRKQAEMHDQITRARLEAKEKEIMSKYNKTVSELVEQERVEFKKELAAMAGKLQAIEDTLKQRAAAEQEARRSQSLWTAAEALLAATRKPVPETKVDNEIKALEKAGEGDKLVQTVVKAISKDAREKGILTEESLKDKFDSLERTATKVALIGREGASLPMYFLSWLQSKLLFQKLAEIPRDELENQPTDFTKLDTFDIIQRARYYMNHGNLVHALRYVNLLQGAPRAAARCWVEDVKRHLEVKQAAETVMAHASLSGLLYS